MIIKLSRKLHRCSELDQLRVDNLVNNPHWLDHTGPDPEFRIRVSDLYCLPSCASARLAAPQPAPALPLSAAGPPPAHRPYNLFALTPRAGCKIRRAGAAPPPLPGRLVAT